MRPIQALVLVGTSVLALGADWARFRGPDGKGSSQEIVPLNWSETKNLRWKTRLPGPGSSSPIVVGDQVFVTCYSGYGTTSETTTPRQLRRHLVCLDRKAGRIQWNEAIDSVQPEDSYRGYITEHGYASHTPVSDGEAVYTFFGKSGVVAYSLTGKKLWQTSVGTRSDVRGWGSAGSPILYKNLVIVNAASESRSVQALDKKSGKQIWKYDSRSLSLSFGTPVLVSLPSGRTELVLAVPGEIWGMDPEKGTRLWWVSYPAEGNVSPSVVAHNDVVYATGGYQNKGTTAVRAGGSGDVTKKNVLWSIDESSYVATPLYHSGRLHWVSETGYAYCVDAKSGKLIYRNKLPLKPGSGGRPMYASLVLAGDRLIAVTRRGGTVILRVGEKFEVLATNDLGDDTDFNATPALSNRQIFLRSNRAVYCLGAS